jgi:hypothetical protein
VMIGSIEEAYDGEISDYLLRARKWINWADERGALALKGDSSLDDAQNMAQIGAAHALLAAVIMLVKETP